MQAPCPVLGAGLFKALAGPHSTTEIWDNGMGRVSQNTTVSAGDAEIKSTGTKHRSV